MSSINQPRPKSNSYLHIYEDPDTPDRLRINAGASLSKKVMRRIGIALVTLLLLALNTPGAAELIEALIR